MLRNSGVEGTHISYIGVSWNKGTPNLGNLHLCVCIYIYILPLNVKQLQEFPTSCHSSESINDIARFPTFPTGHSNFSWALRPQVERLAQLRHNEQMYMCTHKSIIFADQQSKVHHLWCNWGVMMEMNDIGYSFFFFLWSLSYVVQFGKRRRYYGWISILQLYVGGWNCECNTQGILHVETFPVDLFVIVSQPSPRGCWILNMQEGLIDLIGSQSLDT